MTNHAIWSSNGVQQNFTISAQFLGTHTLILVANLAAQGYADHHVVRFQIAMWTACGVRCGKTLGNLSGDLDNFARRQLLAARVRLRVYGCRRAR